MTSPIEKLADSIALVEDGIATKEEVMQALAFKQQLGEIYRALSSRFEKAAIQWIEANGDIEDGAKRYYVGTAHKRTCKDVPETIRTILETGGPDLLVSALSTSCFRPATAMEILGDRAGDLFICEDVPDLKTGKPRKVLKSTSPKAIGAAQTDDEESD